MRTAAMMVSLTDCRHVRLPAWSSMPQHAVRAHALSIPQENAEHPPAGALPPDQEDEVGGNSRTVLAIMATDVTTSTKAQLSWARPKYITLPPRPGARPRRVKDKPLTISELYWANPGERAGWLD